MGSAIDEDLDRASKGKLAKAILKYDCLVYKFDGVKWRFCVKGAGHGRRFTVEKA